MAISTAHTFTIFLLFSFVRVMGSGMVWANSTVLLQTLSDQKFLGRVLGLEITLTTMFEAVSAAAAGQLVDHGGYSKNQLAFLGGCLGIVVTSFWAVYYSKSLGAAHPRFNSPQFTKTGAGEDDSYQPLLTLDPTNEIVDYNQYLIDWRTEQQQQQQQQAGRFKMQ